jgi:hypothetical protein
VEQGSDATGIASLFSGRGADAIGGALMPEGEGGGFPGGIGGAAWSHFVGRDADGGDAVKLRVTRYCQRLAFSQSGGNPADAMSTVADEGKEPITVLKRSDQVEFGLIERKI